MNGFIDLHTHILPEIDDGAERLDESLAMAALAASRGTEVICCTSHANGPRAFYRCETEDYLCGCEELQEELDRKKIPIRLVTGMEIHAVPEMIEMIREGIFIPLGESEYYLIEFPFDVSFKRMLQTSVQMKETGYRMLIAHPERYYCMQDMPEYAGELVKAGALFQCNAGSLLGIYGKAVETAAAQLLADGCYVCVASDAHGIRRRNTDLTPVYAHILKRYGQDTADRLMKENPLKLLQNERKVTI